MADKKDRLEITELFMAQADKERRFYGIIQRETDSSGTPVVRGKIRLGDGFICAQASDQWRLGNRLDELVLLVLDYDIHCTHFYIAQADPQTINYKRVQSFHSTKNK